MTHTGETRIGKYSIVLEIIDFVCNDFEDVTSCVSPSEYIHIEDGKDNSCLLMISAIIKQIPIPQ